MPLDAALRFARRRQYVRRVLRRKASQPVARVLRARVVAEADDKEADRLRRQRVPKQVVARLAQRRRAALALIIIVVAQIVLWTNRVLEALELVDDCLLYTSPSPRDRG